MSVEIYSSSILVSSGALIDDAVIAAGGNNVMEITSGGTATDTTVSRGGRMNVSSGGIATATTVYSGGSVTVSSGGSASGTIIDGSQAYLVCTGGGIAYDTTVNGGRMNVNGAAYANNTVVNAGSMTVNGGASASAVTVNSGAQLMIGNYGVVEDIVVKSAGSMRVAFGGTASGTVINAGASVTLVSDCIFKDTVLNSGASLTAGNGVFASGVMVNSGGSLTVVSGGSAGISFNPFGNGYIDSQAGAVVDYLQRDAEVYYGGSVNGFISKSDVMSGLTVTSGNSAIVYTSGLLEGTTVDAEGRVIISSGGTAADTTVNSGGRMVVNDDGQAVGVVVNAHGNVEVSSGGAVSDVMVNSSADMVVSSGATVEEVVVNPGGYLHVSSGASAVMAYNPFGSGTIDSAAGAAVTSMARNRAVYFGGYDCGIVSRADSLSDLTVSSGQIVHVYKDGVLQDSIVLSNGAVLVSAGAVVSSLDVSAGSLVVYSGGKAYDVLVNAMGACTVLSGGTASVVYNPWSGRISSSSGAVVEYLAPDACVYYGGKTAGLIQRGDVLSGLTIASGNSALVYESGLLQDAVIGKGIVYVSGGKTTGANLTSGGVLYVSSGAALGTTVNSGGTLKAWGTGWMVQETTVSSGGYLSLTGGGSATGIKAVSGACLSLEISSGTFVQGTYGGSAFGMNEGVLSGYCVCSSGTVNVRSGGAMTDTTIGNGGRVIVANGGTALETVVNSGGLFVVNSNGSASVVFNPWQGTVTSNAGASVEYLAQDAKVYYGGAVSGLVSKWDVVSALTVTSGNSAIVYEGGQVEEVTVKSGGALVVAEGGVVHNAKVFSGGSLEIASGGTHYGALQIMDGAEVNISEGAVVALDLVDRAAASGSFINNLALVDGMPGYTLTVSHNQVVGIYKLAEGAADFTGSFTIMNDADVNLGVISVDEYVVSNNRVYTLVKDGDGLLCLQVKYEDVVLPVITGAVMEQSEGGYAFAVAITASDNKTAVENLVFQVKYAAAPGDLVSAVPIAGNSFVLDGSHAGNNYYFQVGVTDEAGNTAWSNAQVFYVEDNSAPVLNGVPGAVFANNAVTVSWNEAADNVGVAGYHLTLNGTVYDVVGTSFTLSGVAAGTYTWQLSAYDAAGNETAATESSSLVVEKRPDLVVNSIKVLKDGKPVTTVSTEDRITVYISVENTGDADAAASTAKIYCGEVLLKEVSLAAIDRNNTSVCTCTIEAGGMSTGVQDIYVRLDANDSITEYNEVNNEQHFSLLVENRELCDLVVGSIVLDRNTCSTSEETGLTFTVKNIGFAVSPETRADIYDGDVYLGSVNVAAIAAGETSEKLSFHIPAGTLAVGSHSIRVVVDGEGLAMESNANNNSASAALTVGGADLAVSKLSLSKAECNTTEEVVVNFTIRNGGIGQSEACTVGIYDGTTLLGTVDIAELDAGVAIAREFAIEAGKLSAGTHDIWIAADIDNAVKEADETNNMRTATVNVTLPDTAAPVFRNVSIAQGAEDYRFTVTAEASDDVTEGGQLVYALRYAAAEEELASAQLLDAADFTLAAGNAGETWYYQVGVTDRAGNTAWSDAEAFVVADRTAPVFSNVAVVTNGMTMNLDWSAGDNVAVTTYKVYFDDVLKATQAETSFSLDVADEGEHTYRIEAYDAAGNMVSTGNRSVRFNDTVAPAFDSISIVQEQGTYDFTVRPQVSDNITAPADLTYRLQYAFSASEVQFASIVSDMGFVLDEAAAGKTVYYRVNAIDEAGNSVWSEINSVAVADFTNPGGASGLNGTVSGSDVALEWNAATDNVEVAGYYVRYGTGMNLAGSGTKVGGCQLALSGLEAGEYYWQVRAVDAAGNIGEWSALSGFTVFPADPYENNDTAASAYDLGSLNGEKTFRGGAVSAAGDVDYFKFLLEESGTENDFVQISYDESYGEVELCLYAANGTTLIKSAAPVAAGCASISLAGLAKGTYILKVLGSDGALNAYDLITRKSTGAEADVYDAVTRNDSMETATVFNVAGMPKNTIENLNLHTAGDVDYYQFTMDNMGVAGDNVSIKFKHKEGDIDLFLYDSAGNLVQTSEGNGNTEKLKFSGLAAGTYYVEVKSPYDRTNEYSLSWKFTSNKVAADSREGSEQQSVITASTAMTGLTISAAEDGNTSEDVFCISLADTGNASSKITFTDFRNDWSGLQYTVKNSDDMIVASGIGSEISLNGFAAGDYIVVVDAPVAGSYGEYSISVNLSEELASQSRAILVYLDGDNNLDGSSLMDLYYMTQVPLNENVEVYVMLDRSGKHYDVNEKNMVDAGNVGNWSDTRVGKLVYNYTGKISIDWEYLGGRTEWNMGDLNTLETFINWGMAEAEADKYTLILKDHGTSLGYMCEDYTSGGAMLTVSGVADLIASYDQIDTTVFDACLMGSELVMFEMAGACEYTVASEATGWSPNVSINYQKVFAGITGDMSAREVAYAFVSASGNADAEDQYGNHCDTTMGAFDTSSDGIIAALNRFAEKSGDFTNADWECIAEEFYRAHNYVEETFIAFSDICGILDGLAARKCSDTLLEAVAELQGDLAELTAAFKSVPENYGHGLAVFNPVQSKSGSELEKYYYGAVGNHSNYYKYGVGSTAWGEFLLALDEFSADMSFQSEVEYSSMSSSAHYSQDGVETSYADLGVFAGNGIVFENVMMTGTNYFTINLGGAEGKDNRITVSSDEDGDIEILLLDADFNILASGKNSILLDSVMDADSGEKYFLQVNTSRAVSCDISMEADWATGVDRFDYELTQSNESGSNGNFAMSKATYLGVGKHSGLASYAGDADWYNVGNPYYNEYAVSISGSGLTVAEYDADGNLIQTAVEVNGQYNLIMTSMNYLYVEGDADIAAGLTNPYTIIVNTVLNAAVLPPAIADLKSDSGNVSWQSQAEGFSAALNGNEPGTGLVITLGGTGISAYGMPEGEYQWSVKEADGAEWITGETFAAAGTAEAQLFTAVQDDVMDLFFAVGKDIWSCNYAAQHLGTMEDWDGTGEYAVLDGKNKLVDIFEGSADANILVMTDDENGDALFVDDIFSAQPGSVADQQARIAQIDEIRAGGGDDVIDLTSQRFTCGADGVKVYGGLGNDVIWAGNGSNTLFGDAGDDRIVGGSGNDTIIGGSGNDSMHGGGGEDIFTFGGDWGCDTVEQLASGRVTLWFAEGSEDNWDRETLTYTDGVNSVTVSGIDNDGITLKFGDLPNAVPGAFMDAASEKIFEDKNKGMLA